MARSKGRTAVRGQDLAGDVIGVFAGKEDEGRSDVLRPPEFLDYALSSFLIPVAHLDVP